MAASPSKTASGDADLTSGAGGPGPRTLDHPSGTPGVASGAPDLVHRFRDMVTLRGASVAVEAPEGNFSYSDLDQLSNRLAHRLIGMGVERDSRVGISLPRGARELLALLATAKAGGAYVPLDPTHPPDRLRGIVEDALPQVMVTDSDSPIRSLPGVAGQVLLLDDIQQATADYQSSAPMVSFDEQQIAYILFTSGSTGRPKGVEISRGAFANFLGSMAHTPGMSPDDRLLAITTTSFDIAGLELFLPLWVGATVLIVDKETSRDPRQLRRRLEGDTVSVMQATPATWRLLLEAGWRPSEKLRMFCGGEAMSPELANRLLAGGGDLWNLYGPTETTVWSSLERITPGFDRITIGRPIDRTQMYILDETLNPVPRGKEGEIWIGGHGLARGYFGRPELTAERFVQRPNGGPGERIYRTGDLGRQLDDGRFECLGRLDHQVKIRGFRIELGEIETILRAVPEVGEVLVVADQQDAGEPRLVAYWIGAAGRDALIEEARRKLPAYMVPSAYVRIDVFPLNTNGKIDRKRLPRPEAANSDGPPPKLARDDTETRIAAIWRQALMLSDVGVDQDFFTLGGTSALAAQVVALLELEMNVEIPLQAFYEAPTVEGIAARLGRHFSPDAPIVVRLREGEPGRPPLWCVFGVAIYQDLARALDGGQPVIAVHVPNRYVPGRDPQPTISEVARRYVDLIQKQQEHGPYHLLGLCFGGIVAHEIARQLESLGEKIALVTILDAVLPTAGQVDQLDRLRSYARRAWADPKQIPTRLLKRGENLIARLPVLAKLRASFTAPAPEQAPIDLPVDGPAVDAAVYRFASQPNRLASPLLIVRATREAFPSWMRVAPDHGWGPFGDRLVVHDIAATHLQVLQEPHVHSLASALVAESAPPGR